MKFLVQNVNRSMRFCLTLLKFSGFLVPQEYDRPVLQNIYWFFSMMFIVGFNTMTQTGYLIQVWGDLPLMTSTAFILFTNIALLVKIFNVALRRRAIHAVILGTDLDLMSEEREEGKRIVKECDSETTRHLCLFMLLTGVTVLGWSCSAEKNQLPLRAWYPFDTWQSPMYQLTYMHQSMSLIVSALLNVSLDTLVTSSIAVCRCRLRLVALSLTRLCDGVSVSKKNLMITIGTDIVSQRLRSCVIKHQATLNAVYQIQDYFSEPIFTQFTVSAVIICVTAYQLAADIHQSNMVRVISMMAYLLCMMLQVFLYCHQGNELAEESSDIAGAAYECPWYTLPIPLRRGLLLVMVRSCRIAQITAGGITPLSIACFTSIIKASYTFFTVLQSVEDRN